MPKVPATPRDLQGLLSNGEPAWRHLTAQRPGWASVLGSLSAGRVCQQGISLGERIFVFPPPPSSLITSGSHHSSLTRSRRSLDTGQSHDPEQVCLGKHSRWRLFSFQHTPPPARPPPAHPAAPESPKGFHVRLRDTMHLPAAGRRAHVTTRLCYRRLSDQAGDPGDSIGSLAKLKEILHFTAPKSAAHHAHITVPSVTGLLRRPPLVGGVSDEGLTRGWGSAKFRK